MGAGGEGREGGEGERGEEMGGSDISYIPLRDSRCPRHKTCSSALGTGVSLDLHLRAGGFQSLKWSPRDLAGPGHSVLCGGAGFQGGGPPGPGAGGEAGLFWSWLSMWESPLPGRREV